MPADARPSRRHAPLALLAVGLLLAGCVVAPVAPDGEPYATGEVVSVPPPAPQPEVYGVAPVVGSIWINGYWNWGGGGYAWVPGYWTAGRPGYRWAPHRWVPYGRGWRLERGHWARGY
jgi:hypothetical protein